jgi:hypothetical protein
MSGVKMGLEALQKALVGIEMGSDLHTAVLKAIADISKHMEKGGPGDQSAMIQQLAQAARQQQAAPPQMPGMGGEPSPQPPAM